MSTIKKQSEEQSEEQYTTPELEFYTYDSSYIDTKSCTDCFIKLTQKAEDETIRRIYKAFKGE